ncbi:unnamed protein product, partial [Musa textilis]
ERSAPPYKPFSPLRRGEGGSRSSGGTEHEKWYSDKVVFLFLVNIVCSSFIFFVPPNQRKLICSTSAYY